MKPLTTEQRAKVTKKTVVRPGERYGMIRRVANERRFNQDAFLEKFGVRPSMSTRCYRYPRESFRHPRSNTNPRVEITAMRSNAYKSVAQQSFQ